MNDNKVLITLYGDEKKELSYQVEQIFSIDESGQMYCAASPVDGGDIMFLRCSLMESGEETEMTIADIADSKEYHLVSSAYQSLAMQMAVERTRKGLSDFEDYITVKDADNNEVDFIIHSIFEDEADKRSYIAIQEVNDAGEIAEEISLYRFYDKNDTPELEMIPSDMEYERARNLFINLI